MAKVLLEDFTSIRQNGIPEDLWAPFNFYGGTQTGSLESESYKCVVPTGTARWYVHFYPYPYVWPDGFAQAFVRSGTFVGTCNRMVLWFKAGKDLTRASAGNEVGSIGTYSKDHADTNPSSQGRHFYHLLSCNYWSGKWHKLVLNRTPQHEVGVGGYVPTENPTSGDGYDYYDGLTRWYIENGAVDSSNSTWYLDEVYFDSVSGEPDVEVATICGVHNGTQYEVSWQSKKNVARTFEIRYSTSNLHTNGWASGTDGGTVTNPGNDYMGCIWESGALAQSTHFYVGIRVQGETDFAQIYLPSAGPVGDSIAGSVAGSVAGSLALFLA